jgi:hypothetical protein
MNPMHWPWLSPMRIMGLDTYGKHKSMSTTLHPSTARKASLWLSLLSILPHIFCCMLPTVAALITLGTSVGLAAALASNPLYMWVDTYHPWLLGIAVAATIISGIINYVAYRMDCRSYQNGHAQVCSHPDCAPKKGAAFKIFYISCALLVLDVSYYVAEEHLFGLHHHGQHLEAHTPSLSH